MLTTAALIITNLSCLVSGLISGAVLGYIFGYRSGIDTANGVNSKPKTDG